MTGAVRAFAPAKINLTLHVTGRRGDGFHQLDSLVVFAGIGDIVAVRPAPALSLQVSGPEAGRLPVDGRNLVIRAARHLDPDRGARIALEKRLPVASGIGGGSSDAAAALRALGRLWDRDTGPAGSALALGADVPVCLSATPARMRGIGGNLAPVPALPEMHLVLANPRIGVATRDVFRALGSCDNPGMPGIPERVGLADFVAWLAGQRNDLQDAAIAILPAIETGLTALASAEGCLLARMSGSGATCFGVFGTARGAARAVDALRVSLPGWWLAPAPVLAADDQSTRATT